MKTSTQINYYFPSRLPREKCPVIFLLVQSIGIDVSAFLTILAIVLFVLAGLGIPEAPRFRYIGWGLAFWALSFVHLLFQGAPR